MMFFTPGGARNFFVIPGKMRVSASSKNSVSRKKRVSALLSGTFTCRKLAATVLVTHTHAGEYPGYLASAEGRCPNSGKPKVWEKSVSFAGTGPDSALSVLLIKMIEANCGGMK
jgi:hypothetical protein